MNIQKMMQQAQEMQKKMADMQAKLAEEESDGSSGGGMVKVIVTGKGMMKKITIDPKLITPDDKEMLEDLIVAAFNDAKGKSDESVSRQMSSIMPAGMKLPF